MKSTHMLIILFFQIETYFAKLDLNISLIDQQTGQTILLRHLRGSAPVEPCETKSTFTILSINNTIPTGKVIVTQGFYNY